MTLIELGTCSRGKSLVCVAFRPIMPLRSLRLQSLCSHEMSRAATPESPRALMARNLRNACKCSLYNLYTFNREQQQPDIKVIQVVPLFDVSEMSGWIRGQNVWSHMLL